MTSVGEKMVFNIELCISKGSKPYEGIPILERST